MGRDFVVTNSGSADLGVKKRTIGRRISIGPKAIRFVAVMIFAALGILYLTQSTQGADRSYKIRDLTAQKTGLSEQRDRLQIEASRLESLNQIDQTLNSPEAQADANGLQPTTGVNYLPPAPTN